MASRDRRAPDFDEMERIRRLPPEARAMYHRMRPSPDRGEDPANVSLHAFIRNLYRRDPDVFGSQENVVNLFSSLNRQYLDIVNEHPITDVCTHEPTRPCWAVAHQLQWNYVLSKRGIELLPLKRGSLHFRNMNIWRRDLEVEDDLEFLCLCLWLLYQHRCIYGVSLCLPVVAPRHTHFFMHVLQFTKNVRSLEIHGTELFRREDEDWSGDQATESFTMPRRWTYKLNILCKLRELVLSNIRISSDDSEDFLNCVDKNESLAMLILIDVEMSHDTFSTLFQKLMQHRKFTDFRIKMTEAQQSEFSGTLYKIVQSHRLRRLCVYSDSKVNSLIEGQLEILDRSCLRELTFEPAIRSADMLREIRNVLQCSEGHVRLKICVDLKNGTSSADMLMHLQDIIEEQCLLVVVLKGLGFEPNHWRRIADALASSSLHELHLEECNIPCNVVLQFIKAVEAITKKRAFRELNLGVVTGGQADQAAMHQHIVLRGVGHWIRAVFNDSLDSYASWRVNTKDMNFTKLSLSFSESAPTEEILRDLSRTASHLHSLSICATSSVTIVGMDMLADVIKKNKDLKVLRLRCLNRGLGGVKVLQAVAESKKVALLALEDWLWNTEVLDAFSAMLQKNRSIYRLELYWYNNEHRKLLQQRLRKGLEKNESVVVLKMYELGDDMYHEIPLRDFRILQHLQRNEVAFAWATERWSRHQLSDQAEIAAEILKICNTPLYSHQRTAYLAPSTVWSMERMNHVATRAQYYSLCFGDTYHLWHEKFPPAFDVVPNDIKDMQRLISQEQPRMWFMGTVLC